MINWIIQLLLWETRDSAIRRQTQFSVLVQNNEYFVAIHYYTYETDFEVTTR